MSEALAATVAVLRARVAEAGLHDPWWIVGSAAAALSGVEGFAPGDVDLLTSERDAEALIARHRDAVDGGYLPAEGGRFRSRFARFAFAPMPVEVMGGLEVRREGRWDRVEIAQGLADAPAGVPLPSLDEQIRLFEWFGREKDLDKARRLRAWRDARHAG